MLNGIINRLRGQVRIRAESAFPERILNLCGARELAFWDVAWESPTAFTCRLSRRDWHILRQSAKHLDCELTVVGREGAPYFLFRFRHRQSLLIGLTLCATALFLGSFFVWDFVVEGNETVPAEKILRALEKNDVHLGSFGLSLDGESIRNHVLLDIPELSWITVNVSGCRAEVQVRERVEALIAPQTAMLGIWLSLQGRRGIGQPVFAFAREALEMLRRNNSHSYLLPLLELMGRMRPRDGGEAAYLEQAAEFRDAFRRLYEWFGYPGYRIWQGISVDNTREIGVVLRMLRKCEGKSRARAIHDEEGIIVTERQLEKIEKGVHKPSYENYQRLTRQYGKCGGWKTAMVEADSVEVLELRQQISTWIGRREWERVWIEIERFRRKVDAAYPRVRQELLFWEALMKWKKEGALEEALELLLRALHCTVPPEEGRDLKWWVFEREESIIASNIASVYRRLGRLEEAGKWFDTVMFSLEQQRGRTGIAHSGYGILMDGYDNYLDDRGCLKTAVKMNEETICNCLKWPLIDSVASMLYRYAWNSYEIASKEPKLFDVLRPKWNNAFRLCQSLVRFRYDYHFEEFLQAREDKFLQ